MTDQYSDYKHLLQTFPFLSYVIYGGNDYIGIIQNYDDIVTTIYDFGLLQATEDKIKFIELADQWWNESNRRIPINVFLRSDWAIFKPILRTFNSKDVAIKFGPQLNLKDIAEKRSKKKSIQLVRRVK